MKSRKHVFLLSIIAVALLSTAVYSKFIKIYLPEIEISEEKAGLNESRYLTLAESIEFFEGLQKTWAENGIEADKNSQKAILKLQIINTASVIGIIVSLSFFGLLIMNVFRGSRHSAAPDGKTLQSN